MEGKWASGEPLHRQIVMFCYAKPAADMEEISKLTQLKQKQFFVSPLGRHLSWRKTSAGSYSLFSGRLFDPSNNRLCPSNIGCCRKKKGIDLHENNGSDGTFEFPITFGDSRSWIGKLWHINHPHSLLREW